MAESEKPIYEFGDFCLDVGEKQLRRSNGEVITIPPKAFELLVILVENPQHLLEKTELMDRVWSNSFVEEGNLKIQVHTLRKVLNETGTEYIETIPRRGYRFNAEVKNRQDGELIVEKLTQSRLVIDEAVISRGALRYGIAAVVLLGLVSLGIYLYIKAVKPNSARGVAAANVRPTSIAVLPLRNLTQDARDEFLSLGLADALIMKLSGISSLIVRPTSSIIPLTASSETPQKVGERLKVEALLEGTIQRVDDRLRISLQLISAADSRVIWAKSFDERDLDVFKFQDAFSEEIATALQQRVSPTDLSSLKKLDTSDPEAFRLYLNARYFFCQGKGDSMQRAIELYQKAIERDNNYALAYAGIGEAYMVLGDSGFGTIKPIDAYRNAIEPTRRSLELDPDLANSLAVMGNIEAKHEWNITASEDYYRRAIAVNPNYARAYNLLAWTLIRQGRFADAEIEFKASMAVDPSSLETAADRGYPAFFAGDYEKAIQQFQEGVERDTGFWGSHMNLWRALQHAGRYDQAWGEIMAAEKIAGPGIPVAEMAKGRTLARQGKTSEARSILAQLVARKEKGEYISPLFLAILSADLGDTEDVFRRLDECFAERNDYMPFLAFAPEFTQFHSDPRFSGLLARVKPLD